ncbi:hypothetical protein [Lentzea guizhouensis]|uniref:hypothetical protein n=1 Tax=Lentzea guizhouensis TaxID=1586287 RepID=UPI0012B6A468|nr:hypothetical protein [Lentzea guizhouensis]
MADDEKKLTFTAVRQDRNTRETPSWRFEVRPGCYVTLFDDGRTRFLMNETDEYEVKPKNADARYPGTKMIEHKPKGDGV